MISILREFTKTWAFKGLMLLLVIGFAIFGVGKFGGSLSTTGDNIVVAGDHTVTPRQFKSMFDNYRQQYEQQAGESLDNDKFVEAGQHLVLINQLADQTALSAWLDSLRVKPSAKLVVSKLAEIPVFLNSVTGRFDKDTYKQFLTNRGIVVADFEAQQRDELAQKQFIDSLTAGLKAPRIYNTAYTTYSLQSRDSTVFILTAKNVPPPPAPTDAELNAFYNENLERLKTPELRQAAAVIFSASNYEKDVVVDESELHKMFEQQRSTLVTPETRSFIQVTAPDMGAAKKIADGLKAGQSADAVAKANKGQVVTYTLKPKSAVPDTKVGDAAFALQTGEVSAPIQGSLGIAVVKMGDIKVGSTPSFESVRTTLEEAYRKDKAAGKLNEVTNAFSDAINKGENFEATAAKLGLKIEPLLPMSSDGHATDPQTGRPVDYSAYGPLVNAVFSLPQPGSTSDVERMSDTEFFAVKLVNLKPAGAPPLAQVREQMAAAWQAQKLGDALKAKATEAQDRLNKGEALAAVAASYGAPIMPIKGLTLQAAQQQMRGELPGLIFNSKINDSFQAAIAPGAIAVGRLEAVHQVSAADANNQSLMVSNQVSGSVAQDLMELTTRNVRKVTKTKTNVNAALRVLNVEPPAADDAKGDKAGKKKS